MNLVEQKVEEVKKDLDEWLSKDLSRQNLTTYGIEKINSKLSETKVPRSIVNGYQSIHMWYNSLFIYELLKNGNTTNKADAVASGYHILVLYDKFLPRYPNNPKGPLFDYSAYFLANCLSEKWYKESQTVLKIINAGLDNGMLEKGLDFKPSAWFIIEMANLGYNIKIDYSKYNYPKSMEVYQQALDNWNTSDLNLVNSIVTKQCDFHLQNATYGDGENTLDLQFSDSPWFVYTFEILAWLSIREMVGLKNPVLFSHPLMNLNLNKLPSVITPIPKNELFEKVVAKLEMQE